MGERAVVVVSARTTFTWPARAARGGRMTHTPRTRVHGRAGPHEPRAVRHGSWENASPTGRRRSRVLVLGCPRDVRGLEHQGAAGVVTLGLPVAPTPAHSGSVWRALPRGDAARVDATLATRLAPSVTCLRLRPLHVSGEWIQSWQPRGDHEGAYCPWVHELRAQPSWRDESYHPPHHPPQSPCCVAHAWMPPPRATTTVLRTPTPSLPWHPSSGASHGYR